MKKIALTQGRFAIVDDDDYIYLSRFKWYCSTNMGIEYVMRSIPAENNRYTTRSYCLSIINFILPNKRHYKIAHKNGNTLDFRKDNLVYILYRITKNRAKKAGGKSSKYKGVSFSNGPQYHLRPWRACIETIPQKGGQRITQRASFATEKEAALWYNQKSVEVFGPWAYQNKI